MFEQEIKAGMEFLDSVKPDWEDRINLDYLNLKSSCNCILGQLYGDYSLGRDILTEDLPVCLAEDFATSRGFSIRQSTIPFFLKLTEEWKQAIIERRQTKKVGQL